jgi:hypothetical protein
VLATLVLLGSFLLLTTTKLVAQSDSLTERIGTELDVTEAAYFGLFYGEPTFEKARFGKTAQSFYVEKYLKGSQPQRIFLSPGAERSLRILITYYEVLARSGEKLSKPADGKSVSIGQQIDYALLAPLNLKLPLYKHTSKGRLVDVYLKRLGLEVEQIVVGELAAITDSALVVYGLDLDYEANIAAADLQTIPLSKVERIVVYREAFSRWVGLSLGVATAASFAANGFSPIEQLKTNKGAALGFAIYPATGFLLGLGLDQLIPVRKSYFPQKARLIAKQLSRLKRHSLFNGKLPPEFISNIRNVLSEDRKKSLLPR